MSRISATCIVKHGTFPIGGTVDGVDQMAHHRNKQTEILAGAIVTVTAVKVATVTTYGDVSGSLKDAKVSVVAIAGKPGWYMKSGFIKF